MRKVCLHCNEIRSMKVQKVVDWLPKQATNYLGNSFWCSCVYHRSFCFYFLPIYLSCSIRFAICECGCRLSLFFPFMSQNVQAQPLLKSTILFTKNTQRKQFHFQFQQNGKHHHTFRTLFFLLFFYCVILQKNSSSIIFQVVCSAMQSKAKLLFLFGWTKNSVCVWCVSKEEWLFKPK